MEAAKPSFHPSILQRNLLAFIATERDFTLPSGRVAK
jgi:hypothetical protein